MAVILQQQQQPSIKRLMELAASQKSLKEARRAADVYGNVDWGDPNAMVSGRVVKTHPVTLLANALRKGMATHYQVQADEKESELEAQKQQAMLGMIESGKSGLKEMAASGLLPPDKLAEALASQSSKSYRDDQVSTPNGLIYINPLTHDITNVLDATGNPVQKASDSPAFQRQMKGMAEALKGGTAKDATGHEYYAPAMQRSPFYQQFLGQDSYDQPTTMMPAPGQPKAAMQPPPPAQMPPPGQGAGDVEISPDASPEDRAMLEQIARQQGLGIVGQQQPQPPGGPALGQSPAEEAAAKAQATMQPELDQLRRAEQIKAAQEVETARLKSIQEQELAKQDPVKLKARGDVTDLIDRIVGHYDTLDAENELQNPDKNVLTNLWAGFKGTDPAQYVENKMGTKAQSARNSIEAAKATLVGPVMRANGLTGSQLNSVPELQQFQKSLTDPKVDYPSIIEQANTIRKMHGNGELDRFKKTKTADDLVKHYLGK